MSASTPRAGICGSIYAISDARMVAATAHAMTALPAAAAALQLTPCAPSTQQALAPCR